MQSGVAHGIWDALEGKEKNGIVETQPTPQKQMGNTTHTQTHKYLQIVGVDVVHFYATGHVCQPNDRMMVCCFGPPKIMETLTEDFDFPNCIRDWFLGN